MSPAEQLALGVSDLRLAVPAETQHKLIAYLALISKWNRVYNLTAVRNEPMMVSSHLLDCLAVIPYLHAATVLDVGSGAGLPGIPLALMWPQAQVTLLDSHHKKATFLRQCVIELGLSNVDVACDRVETWRPSREYELVISRAFSDLAEFVRLAGRLCAFGGTLAAMKGVYPDDELEQPLPGFRRKDVISVNVPGLEAQRHLVLLAPQG